MAIDRYPAIFTHEEFAVPDPIDEPESPEGENRLAVSVSALTKLKRKVKGTTIRPSESTHPGATRLAMVEKNRTVSQSFHDGYGGSQRSLGGLLAPSHGDRLEIDHDRPFCFAPGVDDPRVAWKVRNVGSFHSVTFELFCRRGPDEPFWSKEWSGDDLSRLLTHPRRVRGNYFRGSIPLSELLDLDPEYTFEGDARPAFPDGHLTIHHSPYQLRMRVETAEGEPSPYPSIAWTYLHVVAESIELDWFRFASSDQTLPLFVPPERRSREMALYEQLLDRKEKYNRKDEFPPPGKTKKLPLHGNNFYLREHELQDNAGYERWKEHWGNGPNIPIQARVLVRSMAGRGVEAPLALGESWLLWSYRDACHEMSNEGRLIGPEEHVPTDRATDLLLFVHKSHSYKNAQPDDAASPSGRNCHVDRGGKRGAGAVPVFTEHDGTDDDPLPTLAGEDDPQTFPFEVRRCGTRRWAVRSRLRSTGSLAGTTGVVFRPSRMAGDAYVLEVAVATYDLFPEMDVTDEEIFAHAPDNLVARSGRLEVWRQVDVAKYARAQGVAETIDIDLVRRKMERNFLWLRTLYGGIETLDLAAVHDAYEEVRADEASPVAKYARLAMCTPEEMDAANELDADKQGGGFPSIAKPKEVLFPFLPFHRWKEKMIEWKGSWEACEEWTYTEDHEQPDFWKARSGTKRPVMKPWPIEFRREDTQSGDPRQLVVTISPDHDVVANLDLTRTVLDNTKVVRTATSPVRDFYAENPGTDLENAFRAVQNHVATAYGYTYDPALDGETNREGFLHNTKVLVEIRGHTVPDESFSELQEVIRGWNQEIVEEKMRQQYRQAARYQWIFKIMAEVNAKLLGEVLEGFTILAINKDLVCNHDTPNGKAMFADAARRRACIPMMAMNDDTLYHEFCHSLFMNHPHQATSNLFKTVQSGWENASLMVTGARKAQLCGFGMLKTRGWSFIKTDAAGEVPAGCYPDPVHQLGCPPIPDIGAGEDPADPTWWTTNTTAERVLFGDGSRNQVP